jgi:hypothetical protein
MQPRLPERRCELHARLPKGHRRTGCSPEDAEDLVQGFFLYLLDGQVLRSLEREGGRFVCLRQACGGLKKLSASIAAGRLLTLRTVRRSRLSVELDWLDSSRASIAPGRP